jgi:hypothetical protein
VLRGLQDTRTPLAVAVGANLMNIVLNAVLVLGLGWGLAGSAWGTVAAQNAAAAAYLTIVARGARRAGVAFGPDRAGVRAAAVAGAALVVRTLSLQAVLVVTTAMAARMGDDAIAAHQIAFRLWTLLAFALDAIAIAGQAITGRYLGAGDVAGARAATRRMTGWGAVYGLVFGALLLAARPFLPGVFAVTPGGRPAARRGRGVRPGRGADRGGGPELSRAGGPGGHCRVRRRRAVRARRGRRPGRAVARLQPLDGGQVRDAHAPGPQHCLAGHRRGPPMTSRGGGPPGRIGSRSADQARPARQEASPQWHEPRG